jgi:hypothetical protein
MNHHTLIGAVAIAAILISPAHAAMCADGSYVSANICQIAPDGRNVSGGGTIQMAPNDGYVAGTPRMTPNGGYIGGSGTMTMCPNGQYASGSCSMNPDGTYSGR